nr:helix-turn-helix domain-containing protein [Hymenobacter coccineus]
MREHAGDKPDVAKRLGIGLTTLYRKLQEYGLDQ